MRTSVASEPSVAVVTSAEIVVDDAAAGSVGVVVDSADDGLGDGVLSATPLVSEPVGMVVGG